MVTAGPLLQALHADVLLLGTDVWKEVCRWLLAEAWAAPLQSDGASSDGQLVLRRPAGHTLRWWYLHACLIKASAGHTAA